MSYMSFIDIHKEQKELLNYKIDMAIKIIGEGFKKCKSRPALAFSGGKDSTVLWHLIKTHFPEQHKNMAIIFGNTGVEYPESLEFARELGNKWGGDNFHEAMPERLKQDGLKYEAQKQVLEHLIATGEISKILKADGKLKTTQALEKACPPDMWERFETEGLVWKAGTRKSYWWCVDQYGYPILGKAASKLKARRINIDCFLRFSQTDSESEELKQYYEILKTTKISQACCDILKKEPSHKLEKELKIDLLFMGMMASESHRRKLQFSSRGYLYEVTTKYKFNNQTYHHCNPLSIWTDDDIWGYIHRFNIPYSALYDLEYTDDNGNVCNMKRNGCCGCYTDYGRKNSHMYVLRQTHPNKWKSVMRYGMAEQIQKLRVANKKYIGKKMHAIDSLDSSVDSVKYNSVIDWAIEERPCSFD